MRLRRALVAALLALAAGCRRSPDVNPERVDLNRPADEWLREESVRLLRDYIRLDTSESNGDRAGIDFLRGLLDCEAIPTEVLCPQPGQCNLLARLSGRRREGGLLLLNHIDVVRAFPELWKEAPPFEGRIKLGYLYGRGSYDMKSLGLSQLLALRAIKRLGIVPEHDILFLAEADEESGQRWGSKWLLEHRRDWFEGVGAVLNEGGTNEMILRTVRFWGLETMQAGYGLAQLEADGPEPLKTIAGRFAKITFSQAVEPDPQVVESFDMLANHLGHPLTGPLRHLDHVRTHPEELAALPDRYGAFLEPRAVWTAPAPYPPGSSKLQSLYIVSTPPGRAPVELLAPVLESARANGIRIVSVFDSGPPAVSPLRTSTGELVPIVALLKRVTEAAWPGIPFGPVPTFGGATTSIYFRRLGIPAYGYSPIPVNMFDAARRHGNDERIYLRDYVSGVALYQSILEEFAVRPGDDLSMARPEK